MSIIYDALQKTQRNRAISRDNIALKRREAWVDIAIVMIIAILLILLCIAYIPRISSHFKSHSHSSVEAPQARDAAKVISVPAEVEFTAVAGAHNNLVLNGVLFSDQNKLALINNQTFHQGDRIDGMRIIDIELNKVKLQDGERILVLRSG